MSETANVIEMAERQLKELGCISDRVGQRLLSALKAADKDTLILDLCAALEESANRNRYDGDSWDERGVESRRDASWKAMERGYKMLEVCGWMTEKSTETTA